MDSDRRRFPRLFFLFLIVVAILKALKGRGGEGGGFIPNYRAVATGIAKNNILWYAVLKRFLPQNDEMF